jgi:hypothetical protein
MARISTCGPGSVFIVPSTDRWDPEGNADLAKYARPGGRIDLNASSGHYKGTPRLWTLPQDARPAVARTDPRGQSDWGVLLTPEALGPATPTNPSAVVMVNLDPHKRDAVEYLRNTGAAIGPDVQVFAVSGRATQTQYGQLRRGLFVGAALTMALIGASLLVTMLEQLRDRKKLLAVLVAFGIRRTALAWSVLWQTAIPIALGLVLACVGGIGLGAALLAMAGRSFHVDWTAVAQMTAIGAGVVAAVTLLSLPPLWRLMRPDGLRTE